MSNLMRRAASRLHVALATLALVAGASACSSRRGAAELACGKDNTCLRTADGRVYCFGDDAYTQSKDPSFATKPGARTTPKRVGALEGATSLSLAPSHGCVGLTAGGLRCFLDADYELVSLSGSPMRSVHAFAGGVCGVTTAGELKCFRGAPRTLPRDVADVPPSLSGVVQAAAGERHVCALLGDGTVSCFGDDRVGQLGLASKAGGDKPKGLAPVTALRDVTAIAAGQGHTCALKKDGKVACWGLNELGQLGRPAILGGGGDPTAVDVAGVGDAVAVAAGYYHTCIVHADGAVSCFGSNSHGELGRPPTKMGLATPEKVAGLSDVVQAACGEWHTCVRHKSGAVSCFGRNHRGQLGDGSNTDSVKPVSVKLP